MANQITLYGSPTSPYVRKAKVLIREKGLQAQITEVNVDPLSKPAELIRVNPLSKIPALMLNKEDMALYDSPVICEYLDSLNAELRLIPTDESRWNILRMQALADGILDIAVAIVMERRREEKDQSAKAIQDWQKQIINSLALIPAELEQNQGKLNIGLISIAVALSYLDFRHNDLNWRQAISSAVVDWHKTFSERQSMQETQPPV